MSSDEWRKDAACLGYPGDWWFPDGGRGGDQAALYDLARTVCNRCPVQQECRDYALDKPELYGMWGGLTPKQLERLRGERKRGAA